jgi:hypothetical protein
MRKKVTPLEKWIRSVLARGGTINYVILEKPAVWHESEKRLIAFHRELGAKLLNVTDGGEGILGFKFGWRKRPDLAAKNRARKGKPGRPRMPGETEKLMEYVRGSKRPWVSERNRANAGKPGHKHTEAHKQRMRELMTGRERSADIGRKISEAKKGKPLTEAQRASLIRARATLAAKRRAA